ncbi:MAG: hypothetical protein ACK4P1_10865, partial [Aggregatilineales bacterium]
MPANFTAFERAQQVERPPRAIAHVDVEDAVLKDRAGHAAAAAQAIVERSRDRLIERQGERAHQVEDDRAATRRVESDITAVRDATHAEV